VDLLIHLGWWCSLIASMWPWISCGTNQRSSFLRLLEVELSVVWIAVGPVFTYTTWVIRDTIVSTGLASSTQLIFGAQARACLFCGDHGMCWSLEGNRFWGPEGKS
jgi:hypothetical protein